MGEAVVDDIVAVLPPLLQSLEALGFIARHLNPPDFGRVMHAAGTPDRVLRAELPRLAGWPDGIRRMYARHCRPRATRRSRLSRDCARYKRAMATLLRCFARCVTRRVRRKRYIPLLRNCRRSSSFFTDPALREDADLLARLAEPAQPDTGIIHDHNEPGGRGGFSLYIPEYYTPERAWPLVMALHGGSGNGRGFLWSWLRDARSHGAILVAPTATGSTWALMGEDTDSPNLARILDIVRSRCNVDPDRLLLTGMSDGGTFCYVSGLESASPFTHLAPIAATFHPLMAEMADAQRLRGLPIYLVHGQLDWMFPVQVARQTQALLSAAGADVTYRELEDLSHCYPREMNPAILNWLRGA